MALTISQAKVAIENNVTKNVNVSVVMRRGDALLAVLFSLVLDHVINKLDVRGNMSTKMVQISVYADNMVIMSRSMKSLEEILQSCNVQHKEQD
jgi:hypothetical protein